MSFLGWLTGANDIGNFENLFGQGGSAFAAGNQNILSGQLEHNSPGAVVPDAAH